MRYFLIIVADFTVHKSKSIFELHSISYTRRSFNGFAGKFPSSYYDANYADNVACHR